jgi:GT2 family glycosyltransferase
MHDLAIIIVSTSEAHWLRACLPTVYAHAGPISLDVVVADNASSDGTGDLVREAFPAARVVRCANRGFAHANNRALMTCDARYLLLLNPDTEVVSGTFADLVAALDARPTVGLAGVRQVDAAGRLHPTIRRFPNALRATAEAFACERLGSRGARLGERELDPAAYDEDRPCDWTSGSFMLIRREALESAGFLDERFFMYSDEVDLCRRIRTAGWEIRHLPGMTIVHHEGKAGVDPAIESLNAYTRLMYARKHFSPVHRGAYASALLLRHALRSAWAGSGEHGAAKRDAERRVVRTLVGRAPVPHGPPAGLPVAIRTRSSTARKRTRTT